MKYDRYLTQHDAAILGRLAEQMLRVRDLKFNVAEQLVELLSSAILLPVNVVKKDCVSLFSEVTYCKPGDSEKRTVVIVSPQDANQNLARVSVLAPVGMALIGKKTNSKAEVRLPSGQTEFLRILGIRSLAWQPDSVAETSLA